MKAFILAAVLAALPAFSLTLAQPAAASGATAFAALPDGLDARQGALDRLFGVDVATRARHLYLNDRSERLFAELLQGDDATLAHRMAPARRAQGLEDIHAMWALHTEGLGQPTRFEVIGSVPRDRGGSYTYVDVVFGATAVSFRVVWWRDELRTIYPGPAYIDLPTLASSTR